MNRTELLAQARKHGYTGKDEDALAWIKANLNFESRSGKSFDVDAAWNTKPTIKLADADTGDNDATAGRKAEGSGNDEAVTITKAEAAQFLELKSQTRRTQRDESDFGGRLAGILEGENRGSVLNSPEGIKRYTARKAYEGEISAGKTVFKAVDQIEAFNANLRLNIARMKNMSYAGRQFDVDVLAAFRGKAWTGTQNELGGSLVPTEFDAVLRYATEMYGLARQVAQVVPMKSDTKYAGRLTSIPSMTHRAPGSALTAADAGTDSVKLVADGVGVILKFDSELFEDSAISMGDTAAKIVAESYNYRVDTDYFTGDGTAQYGMIKGLVSGLVSGAYQDAAGATWASITLANIVDLFGSPVNVNPARLMGICSRQFAWKVLKRLETAASNFKELMSGSTPIGCTFLGETIKYSQVMPIATASASKVLYFGDFGGGSIIGERRELKIDSSDQVYWANDQIGVKATARYAINICGDGRGSTVGNIAALKTT